MKSHFPEGDPTMSEVTSNPLNKQLISSPFPLFLPSCSIVKITLTNKAKMKTVQNNTKGGEHRDKIAEETSCKSHQAFPLAQTIKFLYISFIYKYSNP